MRILGVFVAWFLIVQDVAFAQNQESYVGKWYADNASECRKAPQESAELVEYTDKQLVGPEMRCRIQSATRHGNRTELLMRCTGEGQTSIQRELLEVNGNQMIVTYKAA